jgi:hypothetical protein
MKVPVGNGSAYGNGMRMFVQLLFPEGWVVSDSEYCSSGTFSIHSTALPLRVSWIAM